ncbi:predicted protein [Postia placenta Mad-698-R]|nr:predicted protein [Postia placenta Mad-698-R]
MSSRAAQHPYGHPIAALPQALRLARCQSQHILQQLVDEVPSEDDVVNQPITRDEERILTLNAGVVASLEDLFSWRKKDRTSRTSTLTPIESFRFQRAMYRAWLVSHLYGLGSMPPESDYALEEKAMNDNLEKQRKFLQGYNALDLLQLRAASCFLTELGSWVAFAEGRIIGSLEVYDFDGLYLFAGPRAILQCYEEITTEPIFRGGYLTDDGLFSKFLMGPLEQILQLRQIDHAGKEYRLCLVDCSPGENDRCAHCQKAYYYLPSIKPGLYLYNETNWDYLKGQELIVANYRHLKGKLGLNEQDRAMGKVARAMDCSKLLHELFNVARDPYRNWSRKEWFCHDCIRNLYEDTLPFWWLERKKRDSERWLDMDMTVIFKSDAQVPRMRANSITFVNLSSSTPTRALSGSIGIARESSGNDW